ncbi:MAG: hypothetical protein ACUVUH_01120 [bacterium]
MMNRTKRIILLVILIFIIIFIVVKLLPDERKRLIRDINSLKYAVEKESKTMILNYIDKTYKDYNGVDYETLMSIIDELLATGDSINIMISGLKVTIDSVDKNRVCYASCSLGLRVIAKYENEKVLVYGGVIQPASVRAYFKRYKDVYQVYSAKY